MTIETIERIGWNEALHPRAGGKFAPKGTAPAGKSTAPAGKARGGGSSGGGSEGLSFNGRTGAGYGKKGGDQRVHGLQSELNRLGFKDSSGKSLKLDGKLGPKTTAAIKRAQRSLGLKADGIATPGLLAKLKSAKASTTRRAPKKSVPVGHHAKKAPHKAPPPKAAKRPTFAQQKSGPINSGAASKQKAAYRKNVSA